MNLVFVIVIVYSFKFQCLIGTVRFNYVVRQWWSDNC